MSRQGRLLDIEKLRDQLTGLERRIYASGRETIDDAGSQSSHDDLANVCCGVLVNLSFQPYVAPQPHFGVYSSTGITPLRLDHSGNWVPEFDNGAGAVYASQPPEVWAAKGVFHPNDRQKWIDAGVWSPPTEEKSQ